MLFRVWLPSLSVTLIRSIDAVLCPRRPLSAVAGESSMGGRCDHVLTLPPAAGGSGCIQFPQSMMNIQGVGHPEPHFTLASTLRKELISSRILKCEDRVRRRWCPRGDIMGGGSPRGRHACCPGSLSSWLDSGLKSHRDYRLRSNSYEIPRKSKMVETEGRAWVVRRLRTRM